MHCLFVAEAGASGRLAQRVAALERWYAPVGLSVRSLGGGIMPSDARWWLERPPPGLATAEALLAADDAALRAMRTGLLAAADGDRVRLVTGPCGPTGLYVADGDLGRVYATHAVAAAWLATGRVELDGGVLPELLALGLVGGDRCLIRGVAAMPPATCVDLAGGPARLHDYWPLRDRWATVPEADAVAHAETALLRALDERLRAEPAAWLGLTAGLDSRVVAVAAAELGLPLETFTWGHGAEDLAGGAAVAAAVGLPHSNLEPGWHDADAGLAHIAREVRANEGIGRMNAFADVPWPASMSAFLTGAAGEVGRAFWWRGIGHNWAAPTPAQAVGALQLGRRAHLGPERRAALERHVLALVEELAAAGVRGWALLDVLYAEQRLTRWGRGMLSHRAPATIAAFADVEVMRGLVSLPVEARLADRFHHAFLRNRGMETVAAATQRAGVPRPLRRAAARVRGFRPPTPGGWTWTPLLDERPSYEAWLHDEVLAHPLVADALGEHWIRRAQRELRSPNNDTAAEAAVVLSGPAALDAALRDLRA